MKLRRKLILLALAPLVLVLCMVALMVNHQSVELAKEQRDVIEPAYLASKQDELRSYLTLARHAIAPLHDSGRTDEQERGRAEAGHVLARTVARYARGHVLRGNPEGEELLAGC